jgi:hypothetical protein
VTGVNVEVVFAIALCGGERGNYDYSLEFHVPQAFAAVLLVSFGAEKLQSYH